MKSKFLRRIRGRADEDEVKGVENDQTGDGGGRERGGRGSRGVGGDTQSLDNDRRHRSRRERGNNDVSMEVRAQVEADDRYYMHRMKSILEGYPTKGPPSEPSRIGPHVWMGSQRNADDIPLLKRLGITHVLHVAGTRRFDLKRSPYTPSDGIKGFLMIPAEDHDEYDIMKHFPDAIAFLDGCRQQSGRALIHCNLGINRSGAVSAAYLMVNQHHNLLEVIQHLKSKRALVLCNKNFRRQLVRFARARGLLDPYNPKLDPRTQLKEKNSDNNDAPVDDKSFPTSLSAIKEMVERPINGYRISNKKLNRHNDEYGVIAKGVKLRNLTDSQQQRNSERKAETLPRSFTISTLNPENGESINGLRKIATAPGGLHKRSSSWSQPSLASRSSLVAPTSFSRPLTLTASSENLPNEMSNRLNISDEKKEPEQPSVRQPRQYRRYTRSSSTPIVPSHMYSRPRPMVYREPMLQEDVVREVDHHGNDEMSGTRRRSYKKYSGSSTSTAILTGRAISASMSHLYDDNDFAPGEMSSVMAMREQLLSQTSRPKPHRSPLLNLLKGRSRRASEHSTSSSGDKSSADYY